MLELSISTYLHCHPHVDKQPRCRQSIETRIEDVQNLLRHIALNSQEGVEVIPTAVVEPLEIAVRDTPSNAMRAMRAARENYLVPRIGLSDLIAGGAITIPNVFNMDDVGGTSSRPLVGAVEMLMRRKTTLLVALHGEQRRLCGDLLERALPAASVG